MLIPHSPHPHPHPSPAQGRIWRSMEGISREKWLFREERRTGLKKKKTGWIYTWWRNISISTCHFKMRSLVLRRLLMKIKFSVSRVTPVMLLHKSLSVKCLAAFSDDCWEIRAIWEPSVFSPPHLPPKFFWQLGAENLYSMFPSGESPRSHNSNWLLDHDEVTGFLLT